jgi:hypothetical protein
MIIRSFVLACLIASQLVIPTFAQVSADRSQLYVCGLGPDASDGFLELTGIEHFETDSFPICNSPPRFQGDRPCCFRRNPHPAKVTFTSPTRMVQTDIW